MTEKKWLPENPCGVCPETPSVTACFLCHPKKEFLHDIAIQKELLQHLLSLNCYEEELPSAMESMIQVIEGECK